ncbi:4-hydroxy-3-methylbut-2-enyl diphosphate reductase [Paraburkholderia caballeronis]|uniref:4-hydroxy-3-methylbut-2-enyl diphosphate reductase n=1 Tax=Paraburkholderia caballeronis TaxID=416943 RepID=UPI001066FDE3|nr:4-hydroxy-3-methylbut-2-enyl diphosphate reductase [Paraburkholderia caballeronis]TDV19375.1 4-hydroxy-3-methylbut-2-enyl diphosphate reductase [Paraburkholderia caballeronis]TDV21975.1 4-hydroxy-3-methylbut-2-enyl diphosphate reductase [Paraburkholderia caballeronis]TDV28878.1 4-hydroxy-3-methylbut-2-enyl diphosphate reductase [Paraburkholderia caballeronis]
MKIVLANPRGFCAGVERAIKVVEMALELFGAPVYVRHEIVHNRYVVERLRARGAVFVDTLDEVPDGAHVIFSAHGVAREVYDDAERRGLDALDATCPLVTKVHLEVEQHGLAGRAVFVIGHRGHPEVVGTLGHYPRGARERIAVVENEAQAAAMPIDAARGVAYVTQTTLAHADTERVINVLRGRFADLRGPHGDDICYATQNRQLAVQRLAQLCDTVIVLGARNSSNSLRLCEVASAGGVAAHLVDDDAGVEGRWFDGVNTVGVTAGASVPEVLVQRLLARFRQWWPGLVEEELGEAEDQYFRPPRALADALDARRAAMQKT